MGIGKKVGRIGWWLRAINKRMFIIGVLCIFIFSPFVGGIVKVFSESTALITLSIILTIVLGIVLCIRAFYYKIWYCADCGTFLGRGIDIMSTHCKCGCNVITRTRPDIPNMPRWLIERR